MANFFKDNDDLRFYLDKGIDWTPIVELTERLYTAPDGFENKDEAVGFYGEVLDLIGSFVGDEIAPHVAEVDREGVKLVNGEAVHGPRLDSIMEGLKGLDLHGMCLPRELNGQNMPLLVFYMTLEMLGRADVSISAHHGFHGGMALAMLAYSLKEGTTTFDLDKGIIATTRFADYIEELRRGDVWGSMDITEPNAGSDMAALRATATQDEAGQWRVRGQKIFITSGHGKHHFVIARTEKPAEDEDSFAGLAGLSMFLVPAWSEDADGNRVRHVTIGRLEEKLGHHGSATCALDFEDAPAHLIGERGEGFKYMLLLMNNARLGVGFECIGLCENALRAARAYAAERRSMGKTIDRHEMIADYLDEMEIDILGLRALAVEGAIHEEQAQKIEMFAGAGLIERHPEAHRLTDDLERHKARARRFTPLLKYLAAEKAVSMARTAIQIHGGAGYTCDYGVEKLLRDAMVMPIYEGTSQIQSLMVMKDTLGGIIKNPQRFARRVAQAHWRSRVAPDPLDKRVARLQSLSLSTQQHIMTRTVADKARGLQGKPVTNWPSAFLRNWDPKHDFAYAMLHAEHLTRLLVDEAIAEILLAQAHKHPDRRPILERWLERAEPRARHLNDLILNTGQRILDNLGHGQDEARSAG